MSKRCPHCGHYNTELYTKGCVEFATKAVARGVVIYGASAIAGLFGGPTTSKGASWAMSQNTKNWTENVDLHYCCNCKRTFR